MKTLLPCLILAAVAAAPAAAKPGAPAAPSAVQPAGTLADHQALRQLKDDAIRAVNAQDFARARALTHEPFMATVVTQDSFTDFGKLVAFYRSLYTGRPGQPKMKKVSFAADADELSQIYTGTFALTRGSTREDYELADGRSFQLHGRWTGVSIKENGQWKLLAVHTGTNFLDNPVLRQYERAILWAGGGALALGLLLGFILGRLLGRKKRPPAAAG